MQKWCFNFMEYKTLLFSTLNEIIKEKIAKLKQKQAHKTSIKYFNL